MDYILPKTSCHPPKFYFSISYEHRIALHLSLALSINLNCKVSVRPILRLSFRSSRSPEDSTLICSGPELNHVCSGTVEWPAASHRMNRIQINIRGILKCQFYFPCLLPTKMHSLNLFIQIVHNWSQAEASLDTLTRRVLALIGRIITETQVDCHSISTLHQLPINQKDMSSNSTKIQFWSLRGALYKNQIHHLKTYLKNQ